MIRFSIPFCDVTIERELNAKKGYADPNFVALRHINKIFSLSPTKAIKLQYSAGYTAPKQKWWPNWIKPLTMNFNVKCATRVNSTKLIMKNIELKELPTTKRKKAMYEKQPVCEYENSFMHEDDTVKNNQGRYYPSDLDFCSNKIKRDYPWAFSRRQDHEKMLKLKRHSPYFAGAIAEDSGCEWGVKFFILIQQKRELNVSFNLAGIEWFKPYIWNSHRSVMRMDFRKLGEAKEQLKDLEIAIKNKIVCNKKQKGKKLMLARQAEQEKIAKKEASLIYKINNFFAVAKKPQKIQPKFFKKKRAVVSTHNPEYLNEPSAPAQEKQEQKSANTTINNYNMTVNFCPIL